MRTAFRAALAAVIDKEVAKIDEAARRDARRKEMQTIIDGLADRISAPPVLEALITRNIASYNNFVGLDIEPDMEYTLDVELPNPFGGPNFPAKLVVSLSVSEDDPDDIFVAFSQTIDAEKAEAALVAAGEALLGTKLTAEEAKKELNLSVEDEGLFVVNLPTGVVEMFESKRTTKVEDKLKIERHRMRLTNGEHEHVWTDEQEGAEAQAEGDA
jgi:hypothetical protein